MTTENLNPGTATDESKTGKVFTDAEVESLIRHRTEKERENNRLKNEENARLKKELAELQGKLDKGTATPDDISQLQTAEKAANQGAQQGYSREDIQREVAWEMKKKEFGNKLVDANTKDPEFAKLVKEGNKMTEEEVMNAAYLDNGVAVAKHLLKDQKALSVYRVALGNIPYDNGVSAMKILNDFSDQLAAKAETPRPSGYEPAPELSDASDEDQNFDTEDYIKNKY